jgi:excisionase family DNA binding protein
MLETGKPLAYSVAEAARLLSLSPRKLVYLIQAKELRSFKVGKARRITAASLDAFIAKQERAAR